MNLIFKGLRFTGDSLDPQTVLFKVQTTYLEEKCGLSFRKFHRIGDVDTVK